MAKGIVELSGLDDIIDELNSMGADIEKTVEASIDSSLTNIENKMKSNARVGFNETQVLVDSISHTVKFADGALYARVGVFDMSRKTGSEDRGSSGANGGVKRKYTAPMIAQFYEAGIRPHSTAPQSALAKKGKTIGERGQGNRMHGGHAPVMFMSQAFDSMAPQMFIDLKADLDAKLRVTK